MDKNLFKIIADNKMLFDLLKYTLLSKFDIITTVDTESDIVLGQKLRASMTGKRNVEELFREIKSFETRAPENEKRNQAR
jgi:hypothetical protein